MEVTDTVVRLRGDLLITNISGDTIHIGEYGTDQDNWFPLEVGSGVSIEGAGEGIGVVSDGVSEVGLLPGGTGIFPPAVVAEEVDLSGYVAKASYNANTILAADIDDTPAALTVAASTVLGRKASGNISAMTAAEAAAVLSAEVFKQTQTVNPQTGTTYTLVAGDVGKLITLSNASAITLTVPQDSDATIAIGSYVDLYQLGAGQVTVQAGTGATLRVSGLTAKARAQYSRLGLQKVSANTWSLFGDLAAS